MIQLEPLHDLVVIKRAEGAEETRTAPLTPSKRSIQSGRWRHDTSKKGQGKARRSG